MRIFKIGLPCLFYVFQNLVRWFYPSLFAWLFFVTLCFKK
nr:MAG TPA: hypothetical protein [Caudoviricetes sp.]